METDNSDDEPVSLTDEEISFIREFYDEDGNEREIRENLLGDHKVSFILLLSLKKFFQIILLILLSKEFPKSKRKIGKLVKLEMTKRVESIRLTVLV